MLHPCTNATKLNYFDGSKAGFGIFIIVLFLFPVGMYHDHKSTSFCTVITFHTRSDCFGFTVSFLVAIMVAYLRKYRYKKFQRRRKAGAKTEESAVGITGMNRTDHRIEESCLYFTSSVTRTQYQKVITSNSMLITIKYQPSNSIYDLLHCTSLETLKWIT